MGHKEQNKIIIVSYFVSILANFIIKNFIANVSDLEILNNSLNVTTILTLWWWFYFKCGWKLPVVKWIIYRVNLNGTWFGSYQSCDSKNQQFQGEIGIRIKQDFLTISLKSFTEKFDNYSYSEQVKYEEESNIYGVVYTYSQKENDLLDTSHRHGTSELTLKKRDDKLLLEGSFWTAHGTKGKLSVRRITEKQIDTFEETKSMSESK